MDRRQSLMVDTVAWRLMAGWFNGYYPKKREAEKVAINALVETGFDTTDKAMTYIENKRKEQINDEQ